MPNILSNTAIIGRMLLVVGGSPNIRDTFITQLDRVGIPYRLLIQPSKSTTHFPKNKGLEVAIVSFTDERGIRAAMQDVSVVYHLSGFEESGKHPDLSETDIDGLGVITRSALLNRVDRFFYLSSIGADRASGFYFLKAKGIAEAIIRDSGIDATIVRTSQIFGAGDMFTTVLSRLIKGFRLLTPIPADSTVMMQPLWVDDLTAALVWSLDMSNTRNQLFEIGGPEQISLERMLLIIAEKLKTKPHLAPYNPHKNNLVTLFLENALHGFPDLVYWSDFIAPSRICAMDSMPRQFGINPARFHMKLDFLENNSKKRSSI
ncbi:MAG: NAD(P)H-binding protein [Anaerolineaceae bacterium]